MQSLKVIYYSIANKDVFDLYAVQLCDEVLHFLTSSLVFGCFYTKIKNSKKKWAVMQNEKWV